MKHTLFMTGVLSLTIGQAFAQEGAASKDHYAESESLQVTQEYSSSAAESAEMMMSFAAADDDSDGKLSVEEAMDSLPELEIKDADYDGYVSVAEVKESTEDLEFHSEDDAIVGEAEYMLIVQHVEEDSSPRS